MKKVFLCLMLTLIFQFQTAEAKTHASTKKPIIADEETTAPKAKKLRISPVSMSVVGSAQVNFIASGGIPPYSFSASQGSLSKFKEKATLFTPEFDTTIQVYVKDSTGAQVSSEVIVSNHPKE
jgi:hypothetical protein